MINLADIKRPPFNSIPLKQGLALTGKAGFIFEEKLDGQWEVVTCGGFGGDMVMAGERMKNGKFFAFDLLFLNGNDIRRFPLKERYALLNEWIPTVNTPARGHSGEFLEAVLANGGEGVVIKDLDAPYGSPWTKCKRVETFDLRVIQKHPTGTASIELADLNGEPRGWCPCKAQFENVRIGDIVEIAAFGLTAKGKLREPRFVRIRADKIH